MGRSVPSAPAAPTGNASEDLVEVAQVPPPIRFGGREPWRDLDSPSVELAAHLWRLLDADVEERFQDVSPVDEREPLPGLFDVVGSEECGEVLVSDGRDGGFAGLLDLRGEALLDIGQHRETDPAHRIFLRGLVEPPLELRDEVLCFLNAVEPLLFGVREDGEVFRLGEPADEYGGDVGVGAFDVDADLAAADVRAGIVVAEAAILAWDDASEADERTPAVPAFGDEGQQPPGVAAVVFFDVADAAGAVVEDLVDFLPPFDSEDRGPVGFSDDLAPVDTESCDGGVLDDLPQRRGHPATRVLGEWLLRCRHALPVQSGDDPVDGDAAHDLVDRGADQVRLDRVDLLPQQHPAGGVVDPSVSVGELPVRAALLCVQSDRAQLAFADGRGILLGGEELQPHHERVVASGEVVDAPLCQIQHLRLLACRSQLHIRRHLASGTGRLPRQERIEGC